MYVDHPFYAVTNPTCGKVIEILSVEFHFNGTKGSLDEEIFEDFLTKALDLPLPDEEFYSKVNPDIGFEAIMGHFRGSEIQE